MTKRPLEIFLFKGCRSKSCTTSYSHVLSRLKDISREVTALVPSLAGTEINVIISDGRVMRGLNRRFRSKDSATDVLAFPLEGTVDGEVWLCPAVVGKNARSFNQTFEAELMRVLIHGILHLGGFDHKKAFSSSGISKERMFELQEQILSRIMAEDV